MTVRRVTQKGQTYKRLVISSAFMPALSAFMYGGVGIYTNDVGCHGIPVILIVTDLFSSAQVFDHILLLFLLQFALDSFRGYGICTSVKPAR